MSPHNVSACLPPMDSRLFCLVIAKVEADLSFQERLEEPNSSEIPAAPTIVDPDGITLFLRLPQNYEMRDLYHYIGRKIFVDSLMANFYRDNPSPLTHWQSALRIPDAPRAPTWLVQRLLGRRAIVEVEQGWGEGK